MDIKRFSLQNVIIEDVYKMHEDKADELNRFKEKVALIEQFGAIKRNFLSDEGTPNTIVISIFTEFLKYELEYKKDLVTFTYKEIINILKEMIDNNVFTSDSYYYGFVNLIFKYTSWGYNKELRNDIVTAENITSKIPPTKAVDKDLRFEKLLTPREMIWYAQKCPNEYAEVGLLALMEGLKVAELREIKIDEFNNMENHPLQLEERTVMVSDSLYDKMRHCAKEVTTIDRNYNGVIKSMPYADTGYLFRSQKSKRIKKEAKLNGYDITFLLNRNLIEAGYNGSAGNFRSSSILNDYIDGSTVEEINHKYGLSYKVLAEMHEVRYKLNVEIMTEKRRSEGTLYMGN